MSDARPRTLAEWGAYVDGLAGERLRAEAVAANSMPFIEALRAEGASLAQVRAVLVLFAHRLAVTGQRAPRDGLYDLVDLAREAKPTG